MAVEPFLNLDQLGSDQTNRQRCLNNLWPQFKSEEISVTFDGGTTNGIGDYDGTSNPFTLGTVTGIIEVAVIAVCTTNLAGASATLELGTALSTAGLIAQTTATDIDAGDIWHDASPDAAVEASTVVTRKIVTQNIILTVATANITAGVIKFMVLWNPISSDGNLVLNNS